MRVELELGLPSIEVTNWMTDGKPAGGMVSAAGIMINWQNGPLAGNVANGAFVEQVATACIERLKFYNENGFGCKENEDAIKCFMEGIAHLNNRTMRRIEAGVEGTYEKMEGKDG